MIFKRLAYLCCKMKALQKSIDGTGYRMLLRRILEEHQEEFKLFKRAAGNQDLRKEIMI